MLQKERATMSYQFHVLLEWDTIERIWVSYVPALNYLSTYGGTRDEALAMTQEAIEGYLEAAELEGITVDPPGDHAELVHLEVAVS
jgi:predicted RNase H-like HicB family nuclease